MWRSSTAILAPLDKLLGGDDATVGNSVTSAAASDPLPLPGHFAGLPPSIEGATDSVAPLPDHSETLIGRTRVRPISIAVT